MRQYRVGDLKKLIRESANEFEPKLGPNVKSDNKRNNDKSYKDSQKRAKDYDGGLKEPTSKKLEPKRDSNKTTLDYNPVVEPSKEYKERVKAQALGYTSKLEQDNKIEKNADFEGAKKFYDQITDAQDELEKAKKSIEKSGLQARELPDEYFKKNKLTEKRLIFKKTKFVNENHMRTLIPEEYKKDGQVLHMKDKVGNEYIVEFVKSKYSGMLEENLIHYTNENMLKEQMNRVNELMGSKINNTTSRKHAKINEDQEFINMMNSMRQY